MQWPRQTDETAPHTLLFTVRPSRGFADPRPMPNSAEVRAILRGPRPWEARIFPSDWLRQLLQDLYARWLLERVDRRLDGHLRCSAPALPLLHRRPVRPRARDWAVSRSVRSRAAREREARRTPPC